MSYTKEDLLTAIDKLIDYQELAYLIETDLNAIAREVIEDPTETIEFRVVLDAGEFETIYENQAPGLGAGFYETPILLTRTTGHYATERGPQIITRGLQLFGFGFERDKDNLARIFEIYGNLRHGKTEELSAGTMTYLFDLPILSAPRLINSMSRISINQNINLLMVLEGSLFNLSKFTVDGEELDILDIKISRLRESDTSQINGSNEARTMNIKQEVGLSIMFISGSSDVAEKIEDDALTLESDINRIYNIALTRPNRKDIEYPMTLIGAEVSGTQGSYFIIQASFALARGVN